jgi:excisionase family DNA binding protein
MPVEPLESIEATAYALGISPWTVRKRVREGLIRSVRIGRRVLIQPKEIERIIDEGIKRAEDFDAAERRPSTNGYSR